MTCCNVLSSDGIILLILLKQVVLKTVWTKARVEAGGLRGLMVNQMAVASGGSEKEFDFGYIMK